MRNFRFRQAACLLAALLVIGMVTCARAQSSRQETAKPVAQAGDPAKVVLKVGNVQVTEAQIESVLDSLSAQQKEQVARQGRHAVGESYATMLVLSQAALSQHLDSSSQFKEAMQRQRDNLLASLEYQDLVSKAGVTPEEVSQFYQSHQTQFQQAHIHEVAILKKTANSATGLTETAAQTKAEAIRKALAAGEDISKVAHEFNSPNEVIVRTDSQTLPNNPSLPDFAKAAFQLKPGALSQISDRPNALIFYQVVDHSPVSLKDATEAIEGTIRQQKVDAALNSLKKQTSIWMDPAYFTEPPAAESGSQHP
ncbi:MAG: peptidyl-prolyl cis-trans isomerase [Acidobacteriota bacterium]|nr:peptidyl-prolyl cis-trans isomerase [Acidobacteriota bacterium]